MQAAARASGMTTNPNDSAGTVTTCPPVTTVGTTSGSVLSFTRRRTRPETDTNLKIVCHGLYATVTNGDKTLGPV